MTTDYSAAWDAAMNYTRRQIRMTPEKFGYIGAVSAGTMQMTEEERIGFYGQQAVRFTMQVMSGRTISEHPEVTFTWSEYATWRDHLKQALWDWRDKQNRRWEGTGYDGQPDTPPPWMILLWPFLVLFPKWARRHPVNKTPKIVKQTVNFEQRVLYPQMDRIPAQFGMPVIYETLELAHPGLGSLSTGPSRFLHESEVISEFMRDPESARYDANPISYPYGSGGAPVVFLNWLKRNGVNTSQLVKRSR